MGINSNSGNSGDNSGNSSQKGNPDFSFSQSGVQSVASAAGDKLRQIFGMYNRGTPPEKFAEYLKLIEEELKRPEFGLNVKTVPLQNPAMSYAFVATDDAGRNYAYIIMPESSTAFNSPDYVPAIGHGTIAFNSLRAIYSNAVQLINVVVVPECDLERGRNMGRAIAGSLANASNATVRSLGAKDLSSAQYTVTHDVDAARAFMERHSPHAVHAPADFGFTVGFRSNSNDQAKYYNQDLSMSSDPFMAVTGMLDVVGPRYDHRTGRHMFTPVVVITDIQSNIPMFGAVLMGAVFAVRDWLINGVWKTPVSRLSMRSPNLGNLIIDPEDNKKLWAYTTLAQRDEFIHQYMDLPPASPYPVIAIDVAEGRHRIHELYMFANQKYNQNVLSESAKFFGVNVPALQGNAFEPINIDFAGIYGEQGGRLHDTREQTYLNIVARSTIPGEEDATILRTYSQDPVRRARVIGQLSHGFKSLYQVTRSRFSGQYLSWISQVLPNAIKIYDPSTQQMSNVFQASNPTFSDFSTFNANVVQQQGGRSFGGFDLYGNTGR